MTNTIKCPKCGHEFEATDALKHQIEEQVSASVEAKHKKRIRRRKNKIEGKQKKEFTKLTNQISELLDETKRLRAKDEDREIEMKRKLMDEEEKIKLEVKQKFEEEHELKDSEKENKLKDALDQIENLKTRIQQGSQQSQGETLELELESKTQERVSNRYNFGS